MKDRIIELAGNGTPSVAIASVLGCDPSYVSQVLGEEQAAAQVAEMRAAKAVKRQEHDEGIEAAEKIALQRIHALIPFETNIVRAAKVFQVLNGAKKTTDLSNNTTPQAGAIVTLSLPAAAHVHFKLTSDSQVIEIEGRSMVPMQSHQVAKQLRQMQATRLLESAEEAPVRTSSERTRSLVSQL